MLKREAPRRVARRELVAALRVLAEQLMEEDRYYSSGVATEAADRLEECEGVKHVD